MKKNTTLFLILGLLCSNQALFCVRQEPMFSHEEAKRALERAELREREAKRASERAEFRRHAEQQEEFERKIAQPGLEVAARVRLLQEREEYLVRVPRKMLAQLGGLQADFKRIGKQTYIPREILFKWFVYLRDDEVLGFRLINREWNKIIEEYFRKVGHKGTRRITITQEEFAQKDQLIHKLSFIRRLFDKVALVCDGGTAADVKLITQTLGKQVIDLVLNVKRKTGNRKTKNPVLVDLKNTLRLLTGLQRLTLNFELVRMSRGLVHVREALHGRVGLQQLTLNISYSPLGLTDMVDLKTTLQGLIGLQQLTLNLSSTNIPDRALIEVRDGLRGHVGLQQFTLDIGYTQITDAGLAHVRDMLRELTGLQQFTLDLAGAEKIKGAGLFRLNDPLKEFPHLRSLTFNLRRMGERDVNFLAVKLMLRGLRNLQQLTLSLPYLDLSDEGFLQITAALSSLTGLRQLTLDLRGTNITVVSLNRLRDVLRRLNNLQQVTVDLRTTELRSADRDRFKASLPDIQEVIMLPERMDLETARRWLQRRAYGTSGVK